MRNGLVLIMSFITMVLVIPAGCQKGMEGTGDGKGKCFSDYDGVVLSIERGPRDTKNALGSLGSEEFTKTCLNEQYYICWSNEDKVNVNGTDLTVIPAMFGDDSPEAAVSGPDPVPNTTGHKYSGFYPASGYWNPSDKTITLPETRTYNPASPMEGVPMYAESDSKHLEFKIPFALMEFRFTGNKTLLTLELSCTSGDLSGTFVIDAAGNAVSTVGTKKVTVDFGTGLSVSNSAKVYVALAPGTYNGLTLRITSTTTKTWGGYYCKTIANEFVVGRGKVYTNTFDTFNWEGVLLLDPAPGESGLYWATMSVGANEPYQAGDRYMFGSKVKIYTNDVKTLLTTVTGSVTVTNTGSYTGFNWTSYRLANADSWGTNTDPTTSSTFTKYNEAYAVLKEADDVARDAWGPGWHTPSKAEWTTLIENCTWIGGTSYKGTTTWGSAVFVPKNAEDKGKWQHSDGTTTKICGTETTTSAITGAYDVNADRHIYISCGGQGSVTVIHNCSWARLMVNSLGDSKLNLAHYINNVGQSSGVMKYVVDQKRWFGCMVRGCHYL